MSITLFLLPPVHRKTCSWILFLAKLLDIFVAQMPQYQLLSRNECKLLWYGEPWIVCLIFTKITIRISQKCFFFTRLLAKASSILTSCDSIKKNSINVVLQFQNSKHKHSTFYKRNAQSNSLHTQTSSELLYELWFIHTSFFPYL